MATDDKYDRQIRLWGGHGQRALMDSKILALGSTSVVSETLKNLVLPGVGNFTVVDDLTVSERDLGQNFFVRREDLGIPRAVAVCNLLLELNPDVYGHAIVEVLPFQLVSLHTSFRTSEPTYHSACSAFLLVLCPPSIWYCGIKRWYFTLFLSDLSVVYVHIQRVTASLSPKGHGRW
ncbi:ubiquitin-activating enzyme e1, putative, partial [Perkinsus marinus ATCC 50983]